MHYTSLLKNIYYSIIGFDKAYKDYIEKLIKNDFTPNDYSYSLKSEYFQAMEQHHSAYCKDLKTEYDNAWFKTERNLLPYMVIHFYAGYAHKDFNGVLRSGSFCLPSNNDFIELYCRPRIDILNEEINKFKLENNFVTVRRISDRFLLNYYLKGEKLQIGDIIHEMGFMSTSLDLCYRKDYQSNDDVRLKNETMLIIKVPKGANALYIEENSNRKEYELVLQKDTKMIIEDFVKVRNNYIVFAKVIF